jgi:hypothetical protein
VLVVQSAEDHWGFDLCRAVAEFGDGVEARLSVPDQRGGFLVVAGAYEVVRVRPVAAVHVVTPARYLEQLHASKPSAAER